MARSNFFTLVVGLLMIPLLNGKYIEGMTKHYVSFPNSSSSACEDNNCKVITCPVYSIKPANAVERYFKYIAAADQYKDEDFTELATDTTFSQCAKMASDQKAKMFLFDDGECRSSMSLYYRREEEPCNSEDAVQVYMESDPVHAKSQCTVNQIQAFANGFIFNFPYQPDHPKLKARVMCRDAVLYYELIDSSWNNYFPIDFTGAHVGITGYVFTPIEKGTHADRNICNQHGYDTCFPPDPQFLSSFRRDLKAFIVSSTITSVAVDMELDSVSNEYMWSGGYIQGQTTDEMWSGDTTLNTTKKFGYINKDGFYADVETTTNICCIIRKNITAP